MTDLSPGRNRPTLGTLITGVLVALLGWGMDTVPDTVPDDLVVAVHALALAVIAIVVGQIVQHLGIHAPWAAQHVEDELDAEHYLARVQAEENLLRSGAGDAGGIDPAARP